MARGRVNGAGMRTGARRRGWLWARMWAVALVALLSVLPLAVQADTPPAQPTRLPAPAPGVIYFTFNEGFAGLQVGDKYGFIDKTGKAVIPPRFDNVANFVGGLAPVSTGGQIGYIRPDGTFGIPPRYLDAYGYLDDYQFGPEGTALVAVDRGYGQVTRLGGTPSTMIAGPAGFIDRAGDFVIPPQFVPDPNPPAS